MHLFLAEALGLKELDDLRGNILAGAQAAMGGIGDYKVFHAINRCKHDRD